MKRNQYQRHQNENELLVGLIGHINYLLTASVRRIKSQPNVIQYNPC